jgi:hypothetical protein
MITNVRFGQVWEFRGNQAFITATTLQQTLNPRPRQDNITSAAKQVEVQPADSATARNLQKPGRHVRLFQWETRVQDLNTLLDNTLDKVDRVFFVVSDDDARWLDDKDALIQTREKLQQPVSKVDEQLSIARELHKRAMNSGNFINLSA